MSRWLPGQRVHRRVRAFALRFLGDRAAAEDVVQEVFERLPKAARAFRGDSTLETFILSMALRRAQNHVRTVARRRTAMERASTLPLDRQRSPEEQLAHAESASELLCAFDRLPLDQRTAFMLCDVEDLTSYEAAIIANVPDATIRTRLFHARRKLRGWLAHGSKS